MKSVRLLFIYLSILFIPAATVAQPWIQRTDIPGAGGRWGALSFTIGDNIYVAGGYIGNGAAVNDMWMYNVTNQSWTVKGAMPGAQNRTAGISFSINGKGYIGLGSQDYNTFNIQFLNDLWEYDPANHSWDQKASFPDSACHHAACFVLNNKVYVVGGSYGYPYKASNRTWEYDPANNQWTPKEPYPAAYIHSAMGFAIGNNGYIVGGNIGPAVGSAGVSVKSTWQYNVANNDWTQRPDYCKFPKEGGVAFVIGDYAYVGMGYTDLDTATFYDNEFCRYDATTQAWAPYADLGGPPRAYGVAAAVNGKGFAGGGFLYDGSQVYYKDWFQLHDSTLAIGTPTTVDLLVSVYPNPARDIIHVKHNKKGVKTTLTLFDMLGRAVATGERETLVVKDVPNGQYALQVITAHLVGNYKVEISH